MKELERFKKKAVSYREALIEQPTARLLELYPIIWYLENYRNTLNKRKRNLCIVDLMSGSGFLSENLYKLGYINLHAIEFCEEMFKDAQVYTSQCRLHFLSSFDHLAGVLDEVKPDVIISLASFHHLIEYNNDETINKEASVSVQSNVINICMKALTDEGFLLIADLMESEVSETTSSPPFKGSMKSTSKALKELGLSNEITDLFVKSNSIYGASSILNRELVTKFGNLSLIWFRDVVDKKTVIKHADMAISNDLLDKLSKYEPVVIKYFCPWIFKEQRLLENFLYKKFAFGLVDKPSGNALLSKDEVMEISRNYLGIKCKHTVFSMGWNLGIVVLGKKNFLNARLLDVYIFCIWMFNVVWSVALFLRIFAGIYIEIGFNSLLISLSTLPFGIVVGSFIEKIKNNKK